MSPHTHSLTTGIHCNQPDPRLVALGFDRDETGNPPLNAMDEHDVRDNTGQAVLHPKMIKARPVALADPRVNFEPGVLATYQGKRVERLQFGSGSGARYGINAIWPIEAGGNILPIVELDVNQPSTRICHGVAQVGTIAGMTDDDQTITGTNRRLQSKANNGWIAPPIERQRADVETEKVAIPSQRLD